LLSSNLLITRKWRDTIKPVFAELNKQNIEVTRLLQQTYKDHIGKKKGELNKSLEQMEDMGFDYRFIRGLSMLLEQRCRLEPKTGINPIEARRQVFRIANEKGLPTNSDEREAILSCASSGLGITLSEIEESLYSDLKDEFILIQFTQVDSEDLLKQYNLSLTQTLLFYSTDLTFSTIGNWQQIFWQIKRLGLIYTISKDYKGIQVKVDGPASIFKLNRRYGINIAKIVPVIVQNNEWRFKAKILRKSNKHLLKMELNSQIHGKYLKTLQEVKEGEIYDSKVEKDFATHFRALDSGWELRREPEPILVGTYVMIPDFEFKKGSAKVYLEVVGFWTPEYLEKKVKKLNLLNDIDMIIAADKHLACHKLEKVSKKLKVIYYNKKIPLKTILNHLRIREKRLIEEQSRTLQFDDIVMKKTIVEIKDLAKDLGMLEDTLKKYLEGKKFLGYTRIDDMFVRETKLQEINGILEHELNYGKLDLDVASRIIEEAGGKKPAQFLEVLGYRIEWKGIDPKAAKIHKAR
jgi:predicted nuclease of restriction endonuclease-like RecB superfamily